MVHRHQCRIHQRFPAHSQTEVRSRCRIIVPIRLLGITSAAVPTAAPHNQGFPFSCIRTKYRPPHASCLSLSAWRLTSSHPTKTVWLTVGRVRRPHTASRHSEVAPLTLALNYLTRIPHVVSLQASMPTRPVGAKLAFVNVMSFPVPAPETACRPRPSAGLKSRRWQQTGALHLSNRFASHRYCFFAVTILSVKHVPYLPPDTCPAVQRTPVPARMTVSQSSTTFGPKAFPCGGPNFRLRLTGDAKPLEWGSHPFFLSKPRHYAQCAYNSVDGKDADCFPPPGSQWNWRTDADATQWIGPDEKLSVGDVGFLINFQQPHSRLRPLRDPRHPGTTLTNRISRACMAGAALTT